MLTLKRDDADRLLQELSTYRTMWALCDLRRAADGSNVLNASHYAVCLTTGREPIWAVFSTRTGRVDRFFGYRYQIENAFPTKSWRKMTAAWALGEVSDPLPRAEVLKRILAQK